jgi:hypothetical protein
MPAPVSRLTLCWFPVFVEHFHPQENFKTTQNLPSFFVKVPKISDGPGKIMMHIFLLIS